MALALGDLSSYLSRLGHVLSRISESLSSDSPVDAATRGLASLGRLAATQERSEWRRLKHHRMATLRSIDRRAAKLASRTMALANELLALFTAQLPPVIRQLSTSEDIPFAQRWESYLAATSAELRFKRLTHELDKVMGACKEIEQMLAHAVLNLLSKDDRLLIGMEQHPHPSLSLVLQIWAERFRPHQRPRPKSEEPRQLSNFFTIREHWSMVDLLAYLSKDRVPNTW